jgi:excisionase family DNA binding protein
MAPAEELMNLKAASRFLGCSPVTARRMVKRGDICAVRLPGTRLLRFRRSSLERVVEFSEVSEKGKESAA